MSNGMPSWNEWSKELSEEQREYSLYKILAALHSRLDNMPEKYASKKDVIWLTWGLRALYGMIILSIGGFMLKAILF